MKIVIVIISILVGPILLAQQSMEIEGGLKVGNTDTPAQGTDAGTIKWNEASRDFEGWTGTEWVSFTGGPTSIQKAPITPWGEFTVTETFSSRGFFESEYGFSSAISGDYAVIGAPKVIIGNEKRGKAYVLKRTGREWIEVAELTSSDGALDDLFGYSVHVDGDFIVVGAPEHDANGNLNHGRAYLFEKPVTGWHDMTETVKLNSADGAPEDEFGYSVNVSGEVAIVSAPYHNTNTNNNQGKVYLFERQGGAWLNIAILTSSDGTPSDWFGIDVSIENEEIIIGAYGASPGFGSGQAYLFEKPVSGWTSMTETVKLTTSDGSFNDDFGYSVDISEGVVVIGAPDHDIDDIDDQGKVYIYEKPPSGWVEMTETAQLSHKSGAKNDSFGWSVGINQNVIIVGAILASTELNYVNGRSFIFEKQTSEWTNMTECLKLEGSDSSAGDIFGYNVSIDSSWIISGAPYFDGSGTDNGKAYFFKKN